MKKLLFTFLFCLITSTCFGACTGLPKTGQTTVYQAGDDGTYQLGWVGTRFTDNLDGTVTDNATGLMWVRDPSLCGGGSYPNTWASGVATPTAMTWANAITNCEALNYAGYTDWRLPNINELSSIIDWSLYIPAVNITFFINIPNPSFVFYWSGTTEGDDSSFAWAIDFSYGYNGQNDKTSTEYVRPVRGSTGGGNNVNPVYFNGGTGGIKITGGTGGVKVQ